MSEVVAAGKRSKVLPDLLRMPSAAGMALLLLIVLFLLLHGYGLRDAPNGFHTWRESDTATVAENFALHGMQFDRPEIRVVGDAGDSVVGMELPVYNYLVACFYRIFGFSHAWPRILSAIWGCLFIGGMYRLVRELGSGVRRALCAAFVAAWSPLLYYYSHKIQPDVMGLTLSIWGFFFFLRWRNHGHWGSMVISAMCLATAGGIKPTFLAIGLPMLWYLVGGPAGWRRLRHLSLWLYGLGVIGVPFLWLRHAQKLTDRFGDTYFYLGGHLLDELQGLLRSDFYQNVLVTWPTELALGLPSVVALLYVVIARHGRTELARIGRVVAPWLLGAMVVMVLAAEHCATPHDYYYLVMVPPLALIAAAGFDRMLSQPRFKWVATALLVLLPVNAVLRMNGRFGHSPDFYTVREDVLNLSRDQSLPQGALTISVDTIPGYLLYRTGLRGYYTLIGDGEVAFKKVLHKGAQWVVVRETRLGDAPWLKPYLGKELMARDGIRLYVLNAPE